MFDLNRGLALIAGGNSYLTTSSYFIRIALSNLESITSGTNFSVSAFQLPWQVFTINPSN